MKERVYTLKRILASKAFRWTVEQTKEALGGHTYCLVGGLAVAYHANPPITVDADFLVEGGGHDLKESLEWFEIHAWDVSRLIFATRMKGRPRHGYKIQRGRHDIDLLVTGMDKFLLHAVRRAVYAPKLAVPVIRPEDLFVMKTLAGRDKDLYDMVALQKSLGSKLDMDYINKWIEELL